MTFTSDFMTERKKKSMETFEKLLPATTEREDELLLSFMEGMLVFKGVRQLSHTSPERTT